MSRLQSLKPRTPTLGNTRVKPISSGQDRLRGTTGVNDRNRIKERDGWLCQECKRNGRVSIGHEVDHIVPLWNGGTDYESNKELLCRDCHRAKTAREAKQRAGGGLKV